MSHRWISPVGRRFRVATLRVTLGFALAALLVAPARSDSDFQTWLAALRAEAEAQGISAETLDRALSGVEPIERVIELDRRQPEFTQTFWRYLDQRISEQRIERGHVMLAEHQALFQEVGERYGVQPRFLAAFWGLESNYGSYTGDHRVIDALVTLAYDPRRGDFFRTQLIDALKIIDEGHIAPETMMGSWAGAMGHVQFIPSTFRNYAVDQDGDGRRDIWQSLPDALGSAANFLSEIGWDATRTWGREVRLPAGFDWELAGLERRKTLADWQALGVRKIDGRDLPAVELEASLVVPGVGEVGKAFALVHDRPVKTLPVAAGLGGGSADAAAALRLIARANPGELSNEIAAQLAPQLGSDVAVCLDSAPALMTGRGEVVTPLRGFPACGVLLANPGVKLATKDVYGALNAAPIDSAPPMPEIPNLAGDFEKLIDFARTRANDLEPVAVARAPEIQAVLATLNKLEGAQLVRLSGSGPTCFAVFATPQKAHAAAASLAQQEPDWWIASGSLGDPDPGKPR